jgi:membrane protein implicated in regulation of membrane protease activity
MATLHLLYQQEPFWIWLAVACLFVSLTLASGSALLMGPALAAVVVGLVELAGLRLGPVVEALVFVALGAAGAVGLVWMRARPRPQPRRERPVDAGVARPATRPQDHTARLVGRIGRATGDFANGVGRVWIDGAEWGAEIEGVEMLPAGSPVRVVRVLGGIRLQVHPLTLG